MWCYRRVLVCVKGASAECVNKEGLPALHVAVLSGHADAVQVLLDAGADVNARGPNGGNTALHEAVLLGPSLARVIDALLTYVYTHKYSIVLLILFLQCFDIDTQEGYPAYRESSSPASTILKDSPLFFCVIPPQNKLKIEQFLATTYRNGETS